MYKFIIEVPDDEEIDIDDIKDNLMEAMEQSNIEDYSISGSPA
jgi:hypothetical protein